MMKHTALVAILSLGLMAPVASAQDSTPAAATAKRPLQRIVRVLRFQVQRLERRGRISPTLRARLRSDAAALRAEIQAIRQSGQKATLADRQRIREQIRRLRLDIRAARRGRV